MTKCCARDGKQVIDLTPAAIGPYTVPPVNWIGNLDAPNVNMVTCGGQATIPIVAAVSRAAPVHICARSSPRSRRNRRGRARAPISTNSPKRQRAAIEEVGGARRGKAIIVLNPAEPPLIMRDTVYCLCGEPPTKPRSRLPSRPWWPRCRIMCRDTG